MHFFVNVHQMALGAMQMYEKKMWTLSQYLKKILGRQGTGGAKFYTCPQVNLHIFVSVQCFEIKKKHQDDVEIYIQI